MPPPPDPNATRRHPRVGLRLLPAKGREGDPPAWPLSTATETERDAWWDLWRTPQAAAWEQLGWVRTVARYCRVMVAAEEPGARAALLAQATALEDRLGLTPKSMRTLLWQIASDEVGEQREKKAVTATDALERRRRLQGTG